MTAPDKIFKNTWICQPETTKVQPVFGDVHIADGKISSVIAKDFNVFLNDRRAKARKPLPFERDLGGRVLTLPLVNFHDHFYSRLAKGLPATGPQNNFLQILENLWWKLDQQLDEDMIRASVHFSALDCVRQGVTTVFDHHASPRTTRGILNVISDTLREHGLRGVLCLETSDRHGVLRAEEVLQENRNFIQQHTDSDIRGMLGLHAPFTLSDETLRAASQILRDLSTAVHIHLAEDRHEMEYSQKNFGITPTQRLEKFQLLTPQTILGHGIYLSESDYQLIARHHSAIAYNPDSNMNNAVGLPEYSQVPVDIPILPGTDGMHANIARTLKQLFLLYRHQGHSFPESFRWIGKIYFDSYLFVKHLFPDFTTLQPGDRADLVVWDYVPPTPFSGENFWGHWIYGILEAPVHTVVQGGEVLLDDKVWRKINPDDLYPEISQHGERLFRLFQKLVKN